ncbi:DUF202 domain-containing protein [Cellulomonas sp. DKR-3]|uniref:DUF202 domain-containing protein n=1 Tax=Cellulomonas fulva TaxID=2835530 RepID=A0ABS5U1Y2_9CELL|nr:DUF202 domain-containing protein [Cellulomonas fulva]MBT0995395.1 DUF202 domain-containing protein [Cellulomonas fulva]
MTPPDEPGHPLPSRTDPPSTSAGPAQEAGLARERTRLSWRRTALGLAAGSVGAGKLLETMVGPAAWTLTLAGFVAASLVVVAAMRRHLPDVPATYLGGRLVAVVAGTLTVLGLVALVALASRDVPVL